MIGELLALIGAILVLVSAVGVVRLPDVLARLHALAKASTLGLLLLLAGAAVNLTNLNALTSVVLAGILHLLASPPGSNMVSRAAYLEEGLPEDAVDEHPRADRPRHRPENDGQDEAVPRQSPRVPGAPFGRP